MNQNQSPVRILVINLHSSDNAGDAALTTTTVQILQEYFPNCDLSLCMNDPTSYHGEGSAIDSFASLFKFNFSSKKGHWDFFSIIKFGSVSLLAGIIFRLTKKIHLFGVKPKQRQLLEKYFGSDFVISAPGNFLYSSGRIGLALMVSLYSMMYGLLLGKPLYVFPQSIGSFRHFWEPKLVKTILMKARIVMIREEISYRYLFDIGFSHSKCHLIPDVAFLFTGASATVGQEWLSEHGINLNRSHPVFGITMIDWKLQNPGFTRQEIYENALLSAAIYFLNELGGEVILFSQVFGPIIPADDRFPARRLQRKLQESGRKSYLLEEPLNPSLLKAVYSQMDLFIGTRLHSNIFAMSGHVPVLAIEYRHKTRGLMEMLGLGDWVISINEVDSDNLVGLLRNLWSQRDVIRNHLKVKIPEIRMNASRVGSLVASDWFGTGSHE